MRKFKIYLILTAYLSCTCTYAQTPNDRDVRASSTTAEYIFKSTYQENLIPVQVLGAVSKPGMYFIPPRTDLVKLLTMAGGPFSSMDENIVVRKTDQSWEQLKLSGVKKRSQSYEVDFKKLLREGAYTSLTMSPQDVVYVPPEAAWISPNTVRIVTVTSLVLGMVLTGILISQRTK